MNIRQKAFEAQERDPYVNPNPYCTYPKREYDPIDYCWQYAAAVDTNTVAAFVKEVCLKCTMWHREPGE